MSEFIELKISVDEAFSEAVAVILENYECNGIILSEEIYKNGNLVTDSNYIKGYLYHSEENISLINNIKRDLDDLYINLADIDKKNKSKQFDLSYSIVKDTDWESNWKQYWHVQKLGKRIVVCPSWEEYTITSEKEVIINLDPGAAFGTGAHATTRLCLCALEEVFEMRPEVKSVLDVGTGSGILAIAAAKLGAEATLGIDIDPVAVEVANENSINNECNGVCKFESTSIKNLRDCYEIVLVNILAKIILSMMEDIKRVSKAGAIVIFSGLIKEKEREVEEEILVKGFKIIKKAYEEDWVMIMAEKL